MLKRPGRKLSAVNIETPDVKIGTHTLLCLKVHQAPTYPRNQARIPNANEYGTKSLFIPSPLATSYQCFKCNHTSQYFSVKGTSGIKEVLAVNTHTIPNIIPKGCKKIDFIWTLAIDMPVIVETVTSK